MQNIWGWKNEEKVRWLRPDGVGCAFLHWQTCQPQLAACDPVREKAQSMGRSEGTGDSQILTTPGISFAFIVAHRCKYKTENFIVQLKLNIFFIWLFIED